MCRLAASVAAVPTERMSACRLVCVVEDHSGEGEAKTTVGAVGESPVAGCSWDQCMHLMSRHRQPHLALSVAQSNHLQM